MKEIYSILNRLLQNLIKKVDLKYKRLIYNKIDFSHIITGIYGERGIGKTYLMLQKLKESGGFYFSCDNLLLSDINLLKFIDFLVNDLKIKFIYIDEIHKYPNWINLLKTIFDLQFDARFVISGSSSLELYKGSIDLERRGKFYHLYPLNYIEFLNFHYDENIKNTIFSLENILLNHQKISLELGKYYSEGKFQIYLEKGFYPFSKNLAWEDFVETLQKINEKIIIEDLPTFRVFKTISLINLKKIFYFIANNKPSEISFLSLSKKIGVDKKLIEDVLFLLDKIGIVSLIPKFGNLSDVVRKEYKIFLGNPNLYFVWSLNPDIGTIREAFFISQIRKIPYIEIFSAKKGDFVIKIFDKQYTFKIGGKNKKNIQIKGISNSYLVLDNITVGERNIIPLWLFGLL